MGIDLNDLKGSIAKLPLVLVGPIVRRVEAGSVSVFLVLSRKVAKVTLKVIDEGNLNASVFSGISKDADIKQIGKNLFVCLVTARSVVGGATLQPGKRYDYQMEFANITSTTGVIGSGTQKLEDEGILAFGNAPASRMATIVYNGEIYPSFRAPVNDLNHLNIVHGSCRKPHGGRRDALGGLDKLLKGAVANNSLRPQHLFLTGDQIYADDVADVICHITQTIMPELLGYVEPLPNMELRTQIAPGMREEKMRSAGFTCFDGTGKSHCMRMADYMGLYLLAWSDVLWPLTYPTYEEFKAKYPLTMTSKSTYNEELKALEKYTDNLKQLRKVFANVSVLTMFDDHDICDDWFLNRNWVSNVLTSTLGKRIIQNGLCAFAIFQAWGNTPERFEAGSTGELILNKIVWLFTTATETQRESNWDSILDKVLPTWTTSADAAELGRVPDGMRWDYSIPYGPYLVLALDTRTRRGFVGANEFAAASLLSTTAMAEQIGDASVKYVAGAELLILVSGTPVFGNPLMEEWIQPSLLKGTYAKPYLGILKSPTSEGGESLLDIEAWQFAPEAFEDLLRRLVTFRYVAILSGDVHYGFTAGITYWDDRAGRTDMMEKRAVFLQCTSSSLKNSDFKTQMLSNTYSFEKEILGWQGPEGIVALNVGGILEGLKKQFLLDATKLRMVFSGKLLRLPEWEYRIKFLRDERKEGERGAVNAAPSSLNMPAPSEFAARQADAVGNNLVLAVRVANYANKILLDGDRGIIGVDNFGQLAFKWAPNSKEAFHAFWSVVKTKTADIYLPYAVHRSPFNIPKFSDAERPSDSLPK